jgi:hypothetical protein
MLCTFILFPTVQMTILLEFHINIKKKKKSVEDTDHYGFPIGK